MRLVPLACLRWVRILKKETQHFLRGVRPPWIRVGAGRAASGPSVADTVNIPVLQDLTIAVGVRRAGIAMPAGYLPAMYLLLRRGRSDGLFNSLGTVVGMHGGVAVAVENNGRDRRPVRNESTTIRSGSGSPAARLAKPPVVYAAAGGQLGIVKQLLARNVDINARYANDLTLLMWASGPDESVPEPQAIKVVRQLLDLGARISTIATRAGRTALMIAAEGGHAGIADLLLARGADPALKDKDGKRAADLTVLTSLRERLTPR